MTVVSARVRRSLQARLWNRLVARLGGMPLTFTTPLEGCLPRVWPEAQTFGAVLQS